MLQSRRTFASSLEASKRRGEKTNRKKDFTASGQCCITSLWLLLNFHYFSAKDDKSTTMFLMTSVNKQRKQKTHHVQTKIAQITCGVTFLLLRPYSKIPIDNTGGRKAIRRCPLSSGELDKLRGRLVKRCEGGWHTWTSPWHLKKTWVPWDYLAQQGEDLESWAN